MHTASQLVVDPNSSCTIQLQLAERSTPLTQIHPALSIACLQLQKLVSTQETLQQQLATQVDAGNVACEGHKQELQKLTGQLRSTQQQLDEAQAAVAAVAGELQVRCLGGPHTGTQYVIFTCWDEILLAPCCNSLVNAQTKSQVFVATWPPSVYTPTHTPTSVRRVSQRPASNC